MKKQGSLPAVLGGEPAFKENVPITAPSIPSLSILKKGYEQILKSGMITNSQKVQEFEARVAAYLGVKHAIALNSCTSGLILIMKALRLTGEVIMPSFTFHATGHAAVWNGIQPVFADCDQETYNLDPQAVEKAITPRTSAIIAVHLFGNPPAIYALEKIARKHQLKLIFDAAHGFGTKYQGRNVGGFGEAESFSLSPTKLLTAGEGGIVATNNSELAAQVRLGRNYGDGGDYNPTFSGLSARMSEFHALLGIESLKMLERNVAKRNKLAGIYRQLLGNLPGITFQKIEAGNRSSYKDFSILIDRKKLGLSRDILHDALLKENIIVKKYFYPPLHEQVAFNQFKQINSLMVTKHIANNSLSIPLFSHMKESTAKKIAQTIRRAYNNRQAIKTEYEKNREAIR